MSEIKILIADKVIQIISPARLSNFFFRLFLVDKEQDLSVYLCQDEIVIKNENSQHDWEGFLNKTSLLRKLSDSLLDYSFVLVHGAVIAFEQKSYLFTAPSGTGKTTHIMKWLENCPEAFVVNGDKPFIRIQNDGQPPLACGSPWAGKENMYTNTMVPLKSIILMERAEDNHIEQISFAEAFPALLQQVYRPDDPVKMRKTLQLMQRLSHTVTFWRFQCNNFKDDCFQVAYSALHG